MKKTILVVMLALITATSFGQVRPQGSTPDTVVSFVTPYAVFIDPAQVTTDTAQKVAVRVSETLKSATFQYWILDASNRTIKNVSGTYQCAGACLTQWSNNRTPYQEAVIVEQYVLLNDRPIQ